MTSSRGEGPRAVTTSVPRVAILGRPNVGKSTLFNVLLGRRRAITFSDPGVTRDPVEVPCTLAGARMLLIDTGGYTSGSDDEPLSRAGTQGRSAGLDRVVAARSLKSAAEADLVLLVLDAAETTAEDEDFLRRVRPFSEKIILVVNKVDTPDRDTLVWNAHAHGFPNVIGVSAAHGRGIARLKETIAGALEARLEVPLSSEPARRTAREAGTRAGREDRDPGKAQHGKIQPCQSPHGNRGLNRFSHPRHHPRHRGGPIHLPGEDIRGSSTRRASGARAV